MLPQTCRIHEIHYSCRRLNNKCKITLIEKYIIASEIDFGLTFVNTICQLDSQKLRAWFGYRGGHTWRLAIALYIEVDGDSELRHD